MDSSYHTGSSDGPQPPGYKSGYREPPYTVNGPSTVHGVAQPNHTTPPWTHPHGYDGASYGFRYDFPPPSHGERVDIPYGFDPSVPPPPFACPTPFPNMMPSAPGTFNPYNSQGAPTFQTYPQPVRPGPQTSHCEPGVNQEHQQHEYDRVYAGGQRFSSSRLPPRQFDQDPSVATTTRAEEERTVQRKQDLQWVRRLLQARERRPETREEKQLCSVSELKEKVYRAAQLVSQLTLSCQALGENLEDQSAWTNSYLTALKVKKELQDKLGDLDGPCLDEWKTKLSRLAKRKARRLRARKVQVLEEKQRLDRISEKEAMIDKWRMQQIRRVEEKKKEQELKLAADSVLCEVRKKQADVKRMQDILRSLEKLRRLRKEAAMRKGIVTDQQSEEVFDSQLQQLRNVLKKRTSVYSAEEKALMVMLEGEQEEERKREREQRARKDREKLLQRKRRVDAMLFGDDLPADPLLQPFRDYYTHAERSLHALLQIRGDWDVFVVPVDHPEGSAVPQSWVLPEAPSDQNWASALQTSDDK
ncbi:uncharacterized protein V6R79_022115 [Siganus canaliculatus]